MYRPQYLSLSLSLFLSASLYAGDWTQWRGPDRSGVYTDKTMLTSTLEGKAPEPVWKSEKVLSYADGGFASPVVADGKVYVFCSWQTWTPLTERKFAKGHMNHFGRTPPKDIPEELLKKVEEARLSEERSAIKDGKVVRTWAKEWLQKNLTEEQMRPLGGYVTDRLHKGKGATPLEVFEKLKTIIDLPLENQEALDKWLTDNGIEGDVRRRIDSVIPKKTGSREDVILCLDAKDGKTLWKQTYPSRAGHWGLSSTPCVADGKLYLVGGQGTVYCLETAKGEEQWTAKIKGAGDISSSFALVDGKLVVLAGRLVALDAKTGEQLWEQRRVGGGNGSPAIWMNGAKSYLVAGENRLCCIDPTDGKVVWETQGSGCGTPSISGNTMVTEYSKGLRIYALSTTEATLVKELEQGGSRGCSAIASDGKAYACGRSEVLCVDTKTGEVLWTVKRRGDEFSSPILAGGKLLAFGQGGLGMFDAQSGESLGVLKMEFATCTSPALADGMLYVRLKDAIACYSLK